MIVCVCQIAGKFFESRSSVQQLDRLLVSSLKAGLFALMSVDNWPFGVSVNSGSGSGSVFLVLSRFT